MKILLLLLLPFNVIAGQISIQESTRLTDTNTYYISTDRRIQYTSDNYFIQIRRAGVCPYYCGFNYEMLGIGIHSKQGRFFAQSGIYYVRNTLGRAKFNENLFYYLNARFKSFDRPVGFSSYEVKNDKITFGITVGYDFPLNKKLGIKISYQYLKVKENIIGYFTEDSLWWDPLHRDLSAANFGFYYNF
jgi:hypothetical protein